MVLIIFQEQEEQERLLLEETHKLHTEEMEVLEFLFHQQI